jgi:hypothetical protein
VLNHYSDKELIVTAQLTDIGNNLTHHSFKAEREEVVKRGA